MHETSTSLLARLRDHPDSAAWQRLVVLYQPFVYHWLCSRHALQEQDANDVVQATFLVVLRRLPEFVHNGQRGAFHKWLRNITRYCLREFWKARGRQPMTGGAQELLEKLQDPRSGFSQLWDQEHQQYLARRILELVEPEFEASTLRAFRRVVLEGAKPVEVAAEMGLTRNAVDLATSRVRRRLRRLYEEIQDLLD